MKWLALCIVVVHLTLDAQEVFPIAIIGSGPAGLGAALVTGREKVETHLFLGHRPGGPLNAVTCAGNWPGSTKGKGHVVIKRIFDQLQGHPVYQHEETVQKVDFSKRPFCLWTDKGNSFFAETVIIASGALPKQLGVVGEAAYFGKGIKTALYKPDAPHLQGKIVAVVGGGTDAVKKACIATKSADRVYLIVRGPALQKPFMEKKLLKKGITMFYETEVRGILGNGNELTHLDLGSQLLKVDTLLLAAGIVPNTGLFHGQLELDEQGCIFLEGRTQKTSIPGVFAAGTATDAHYRQAAISCGEGMKAGYDALEFLQSTNFSDRLMK